VRKLLIGTCVAAMIAYGSPVHSQLPVTDGGNLVAQAKSLLQELKSYATQLQQLQQEVQSVMWAAQTAQSFIQNPNLGAAMALMNMVGIENPLPINPYAVQSLVSGYGGMNNLSGLTGKLNSLNGLVTDSYSADRVYACDDGSYACARQQQVATSNAGIKGLTSQIYQQLTEHIPVLQSLRTQLGTASDPAQREHIMAQLAIENTWTANAQGQLQTVTALASAQENVLRAQDSERVNQSIDRLLASAPK